MRDTHEPAAQELLPPLDVQVPDALQANRRHLQDHLPAGLRAIQLGLLVSLFIISLFKAEIEYNCIYYYLHMYVYAINYS